MKKQEKFLENAVFPLSSALGMRKLGMEFGKYLLNLPLRRGALAVGLRGNLGSGKTTFVQGVAKVLGVQEKVLSPTFVIWKSYSVGTGSEARMFSHIDCYRTAAKEDLLALGWRETIKNPRHIIVIEWAEKIPQLLPEDAIVLSFSSTGEKSREIKIISL
ncbi:MAG: tRNA (adenosine(37)-N6)-threonylcarbamoyltransferase complex ATPase subunit type 1 TsaE [Candidatus Wildermuthbacteria bacterium]|nr:tRNA (adenosine(37)-N6)-threonylcarbamoyltransferase complex ATPase subunit type 1 TsaE [Candidatus Wildermuthbacteria bacterium]